MKKLLLTLAGGILLTACSGNEEPRVSVVQEKPQIAKFPTVKPQEPCTINGHDCWKVVQGLKETKIIPPTEEEFNAYQGPDDVAIQWETLTHYDSPQYLKDMGITIKFGEVVRDGGSLAFTLRDGTFVFINQPCCDEPEYGYVTITWPDGTKKKFDPQGNLVK